MAMILPEVVLQRVLQRGIKNLRNNPEAFNDIFCQYLSDELKQNYGQSYIDGIRQWFMKTKIPVLQAFSFDPTKIPCISIHLGVENEDESKAAFDNLFGIGDDGQEILVGVDQVVMDIGIHADKGKDYVLWLFYIMKYIIYKNKYLARKLGLQNQTWSASEYNKAAQYMTENVYTRWIRYRCTVQNFLEGDAGEGPYDVEVDIEGQPIGSLGDDNIVDI